MPARQRSSAHSRVVTNQPTPFGALDVLGAALDVVGRSTSDWATGALADCGGPGIELSGLSTCPGSRVALRRFNGRPCSNGCADLRPPLIAHADPSALPVATNAAGAVLVTMCLQSVDLLDELFGELRRILRPTGTLVALLPARPGWSLPELNAWRPLLRALGPHAAPRHSSARNHPNWLFAAADFALLLDQRRQFWLPLPDGRSAGALLTGLIVAGILPPSIPERRLAAANAALVRLAAPGRRIPIPLRLVVGRR
jgi:SAM-dependent methyltransferase